MPKNPWGGWRIGIVTFTLAAAFQTSYADGTAPAADPSQPVSDSAQPSSQGAAAYRQMSLEDLMNLDVTSVSKEAEPYGEAPAAIDVITSDDIRRSGASDIPEALRLADNLEVAQQGSHTWNISARGFNTDLANKLLVLMDGRSVYTPLYSGVFWDQQNYLLEDIDRIEVISGPGGTLWGANAVNGVINITSKSAKDTQGLYVEGGGGTQLEDFTGIRYGGTLAPGVFFRVYGMYSDQGDDVIADGANATDASRMGQVGFRMDTATSQQNTFTLQGDAYGVDEDLETGGGDKSDGDNILGRWSHVFSEDSDMTLQLYYDRTHITSFEASNGFAPAGFFSDTLDTYDMDLERRFHLGSRNRIVVGLGYRFTHDVVVDAPSLAFTPPILNQNLYNTFAQDEIVLAKDLNLTIGSKLEHNDYTGFEVEPSIRLQWNPEPKQMLWAAISRAVRTPSRIDHDLEEPTGLPSPLPKYLLLGGSNFVSETLVAYEMGYRAQLGPKADTSISIFYNDYDNIRSTTPGPVAPPSFGFPLVFQNNLKGDTYGLELSANYQVLDWWRMHGGYDLLEENIYIKAGQVDFNDALNETADPKNQWTLRSSMDLPHNLELDAALRWVDTLRTNDGPTPGYVPSYTELNARLGWHVTKGIELSIVGENLLHNYHTEYGYPEPTREGIKRSAYAKAVWHY